MTASVSASTRRHSAQVARVGLEALLVVRLQRAQRMPGGPLLPLFMCAHDVPPRPVLVVAGQPGPQPAQRGQCAWS